MNSHKGLPVLMWATILAIIAFQVYWMRENYEREKKTMQIKAGVTFRETIRELQTFNLKIPDSLMASRDLSVKPKKIFISKQATRKQGTAQREEVITIMNTLRRSIHDSLKVNFMVTTDSGTVKGGENLRIRNFNDTGAFRYLYGLDALQDTLKPEVITEALVKNFKKNQLNIPFTVERLAKSEQENDLTDVVVGFVNPVTYHLKLGNTVPYLTKRILLPLLFSIFLVTVTVCSFVLLYRNVLKQRKLAEMKNDFISNITHELKTPIATVGVAIEAMKSFNAMHDEEKTKEYLDISANELQRLDLLVDNVLKISLFEKRKLEIIKESVDLNVLINEVLDTMRLQFIKNNATVNFTSSGKQTVIRGDKLHLISVMYNLLDNAIKYKREQPVINIELVTEAGFVYLTVKDNGVGIDPAYKARIFEKFFRVPSGNNHSVKGYGLGLSYVSHIIEQHNGSIRVDSVPGQGSSFTIKFPI